jgi:glyoxylase-like metal-dependent hydrolase (beta-lactamase superfamily II)
LQDIKRLKMKTMRVGKAHASLFSIGDLRCDLAAWLDLPRERWPAGYTADLSRPLPVPIQSVHVNLPRLSLLVDAPLYEEVRADSDFAIAGYRPPPGLVEQLRSAGIRPEDVTHIVITHPHFDHFGGITRKVNGRYEPAFPNARCYLSQADWTEIAGGLQRPNSLTSRTLGVIQQAGLLELVAGEHPLVDGVTVLPAPGETAGHQIVRVHSAGETLYLLGDLYHHAIEIEHPALNVHWADPEQMATSKQTLIRAALAENAILVATHIPGFGRLRPTDSGVTWVEV